MSETELFFEVKRGALAARSYRQAEKVECPVLALHGWLDNAASFSRLSNALDRRAVLAVDMAGHGHSFHLPDGGFYYVWEYAIDIVQLLEQLPAKRVDLVGHSLGGGVAVLVAVLCPEKVRSLTLIESTGPVAVGEDYDSVELMQKSLKGDGIDLKNGQVDSRARTAQSKPRSLESLVLARQRARFGVDEAMAQALVERGAKPCAEDSNLWQWRHDPQLMQVSPVRLTEGQVRSWLASVLVPVLHISGDQGNTSDNDIDRLQCIRALRMVEFPGNHHLHTQVKGCQRIAETLQIFLESLDDSETD